MEGIYRQLFNPQLYLLAYGRIYSNKGAMTPGPDAETADGMTMGKIERIIDAVRHERFRFRPVRRHYIPKKDGRKRPLGLPSWSDKLLGEVMRLLLEAYYEPQFSDHSHGYRPGRGCHTALREVAETWTGTSWFIEGDISQCFDRLDSRVMLETLGEKIHDNRLLRLVGQMLAAGYLEDWVWNATLSGVPQGGVLSPCLSNIYLNRLDTFVETVLIPGYTRGVLRKHNPEYQKVQRALARARHRRRSCRGAGRCASSCAISPAWIRTILATGGCVTCDTPMTPCSGSPDRRKKPRRSSVASPSSCVMTSSWSCPRPRR